MKTKVLFLIPLLAALPSFAAEPPKPATTGPQVYGLFRFVSADGIKVLQQASIATGNAAPSTITISGADAFISGSGKCAFNVKYDEASDTAASDTTNRLYANDRLIAQNTLITLVPRVLKTIWTQPYLSAGVNNIRIVVNADSATPSTGWVKVNVTGSCGGVTAPAPQTAPPPPPPPPVVKPPVVPPVVRYAPGSGEWNTLYTAWGYSNYGTTQLKGKGYARYADLVKLNADLSAVVAAKSVEQSLYTSLMARWNSFVNDAAFKAAMIAAVTPSTAGKK
jgi:hypothetical protein